MKEPINQIRILFVDLPARARKLNPGEISSVFGGCVADGQPCVKGVTACCGDSTHGCWTNFSKNGTCGTGNMGGYP
jgi:hypothetical protein